MKLRRIGVTAAACCWVLSGVMPAQASYWNYGCKGTLGDKDSGYLGDSVVAFDRNALVVLPADFAKGDIAGLGKGQIYAFETDADPMAFNDPSFKPTMSFTRTAYPDQKIVLTEKSRKTISQVKGHIGTRETYTGRFKITYHYRRTGWQFELPEADIAMDCFEKRITAP
jgi:hypothetical protein